MGSLQKHFHLLIENINNDKKLETMSRPLKIFVNIIFFLICFGFISSSKDVDWEVKVENEFIVKWNVSSVMSTISGDNNSRIFVSMKTKTEERISVPKLVTDGTLKVPFSTCEVHELRLAYLAKGANDLTYLNPSIHRLPFTHLSMLPSTAVWSLHSCINTLQLQMEIIFCGHVSCQNHDVKHLSTYIRDLTPCTTYNVSVVTGDDINIFSDTLISPAHPQVIIDDKLTAWIDTHVCDVSSNLVNTSVFIRPSQLGFSDINVTKNKKQENILDSTSFEGVFINNSPLRENVITRKLKECTDYEVRLQNIYKAGFETITDELLSHEKTVCKSGFSQMTLISLVFLFTTLALVTAILIIILMVKRNKISDSKYLALPHL